MSPRGVVATSLAATLVLAGAAAAQASVTTNPLSCVQPDGRVSAVAISGGTAYLGGSFTHVKDKGGATVVRNRLAAVDTATCALLPWAPSADSNVLALAVQGSTVLAGGDFTHIGTTARNHLAGLATGSGALTSFNPNVNNSVRALAVSGSTLYAGGTFTSVGGTSRSKLAAFSTADGSLAAWKPKASGAVNALTMSADGSDVYVGGTFTAINGTGSAAYLAAVKASGNGALDPSFDPAPTFPILALAADQRGVYAGAGGSGGHFVIWNLDGSLQRPVYQTDGGVQGVAVDGDSVYAGGHFTNYCVGNTGSGSPFLCSTNLPRRKMFEVSLSSGNLTGWNPALNSAHGAFAVVVDPATHRLWVGGDFTTVNGSAVAHLAVFPPTP
ncbi:hypothetical protein [Oryzihumus sp.]